VLWGRIYGDILWRWLNRGLADTKYMLLDRTIHRLAAGVDVCCESEAFFAPYRIATRRLSEEWLLTGAEERNLPSLTGYFSTHAVL
jgi:hypothetical protein